jgi:hypothetical protein
MTYREAFDTLGKPRRKPPALRRHYRIILARWMGVVLAIWAWASLVSWLDGAL